MTESEIGPLPHWVLETIYPSLESPEFMQAFQSVGEQCDAIDQLLDERQLRRGGWVTKSAEQAAEAVEAYLTASNRMVMLLLPLLLCQQPPLRLPLIWC